MTSSGSHLGQDRICDLLGCHPRGSHAHTYAALHAAGSCASSAMRRRYIGEVEFLILARTTAGSPSRCSQCPQLAFECTPCENCENVSTVSDKHFLPPVPSARCTTSLSYVVFLGEEREEKGVEVMSISDYVARLRASLGSI